MKYNQKLLSEERRYHGLEKLNQIWAFVR
jgi:hypothetical protein